MLEDMFLVFDVIYLFQLDDLLFMQHFQSIAFPFVRSQIDLSECSCTNDPYQCIFRDRPINVCLGSLDVGIRSFIL